MYFAVVLPTLSALLVMASAQFPQYPSQFPEGPVQTYGPPQPFYPFRAGSFHPMRYHMPPRENPFDHVFNEKGDRLSCKMVCSPSNDLDDVESPPEKKESAENRIEKKE
ncbi:hypothetical protein YQE_08422, partial [Dendroctonus ponderosae]